MTTKELIIDLNFKNKIIDERLLEPFNDQKMFDLLTESVIDKRTLKMIEIHDLFRAVDHTMTMVGAARLFYSLNKPSKSLKLIQAKQESLKELESNDRLRNALEEYLGVFSKGESDLFKFLNAHYLPIFPYRDLNKAAKAGNLMLKAAANIPPPETGYLDSLLRIIRSFGDSPVSGLAIKPTYRTLKGIKTRREKGFFSPGLRFRPGRASFGSVAPALPSILAAAAGLTGIIDPVMAESLALLTGGGIMLGLFYGGLAKPILDNETAILPIRKRFLNSSRFTSAVEAVADLDELLSFNRYRRNMPHTTIIPEITDGARHHFMARGLKNPVSAKNNKNYIPNDVNLDGSGVTFITGPNSGGKTTYCKTIVQSQILAQIGAPLVADSARINIADRIAYQAPAFDSLNDPEGRFGTELRTTRDIFYSVTPKSLAVLDEIAEGTTIHEKMTLSVAVLKGLFAKGNNTLLVTHSYELVEMFKEMNRGQYLQVDFKGEEPTHRLIEGISWDSHAYRVAEKIGFSPEDIQKHLKDNGYLS